MDTRLYRVDGHVQAIGLADVFFSSEQLVERGMTGDERLLIVRVNENDPGDVPFGIVWAKSVQITIREIPPAS